MSRKRSATAQAIREIEPSPENQEELLGLIRLIEYSQGFTLAFARCNQVPLRQEMAGRLREALASLGIEIIEVDLKGPLENLREAILAHIPAHLPQPRLAVMVYGLEHSIPSDEVAPPVLGVMNMGRDLYRRDIPYPLVLWLPEYAMSAVAREAPDFWHWRSGVFQFTTPPGDKEQLTARTLHDGDTANLTLERKKERIYVLDRLLEDYQEVGEQGLWKQRRQAELLHSLASVHYEIGHYGEARRLYQESLDIKKELGDRAGIAATLHHLAMVSQDQGDLAEARRLYQESLEMKKELGNRASIASSLHQLGLLAQRQGDLAEAHRLYQESLEIDRELGNRVGIATSLHQLGTLAQDQGDLAEAHRLYQESLVINEELGNRAGIASSLHNLGVLAQDQGDVAEAHRLYQESLEIDRELGNRVGIATSLHQLGTLAQDQGDLAEAHRLYQESLSHYKEMGLLGGRDASIVAASLKRVEEMLSEKERTVRTKPHG